MSGQIFDTFFLVFGSAALAASFALFTRQPLLIAYILVGIILGPFGLKLFDKVDAVSEISHIGIIFLLFLLGLDLQPQALFSVLRKASIIVVLSSAIFALIGFLFAIATGFSTIEAFVFAMASMFSSTIIGIKLLPTTILHHKHVGEMIVGLLLVQDIIAIFCLLLLLESNQDGFNIQPLLVALIFLPVLVGFAYLSVKYVLIQLIKRFDRFSEYTFLLAIGWCLSVAALAEHYYLSAEIGAFIAGISLASSPISKYLVANLKPLRDFFLILFFFSLGAQLNIDLLGNIIVLAIAFAAIMLAIKPIVFYVLLRKQSEKTKLAWDISFRLGQISEFSLLITFLAFENMLITERASVLIQSATILTFIVSSYIVTFNFANPLAIKDHLRRD